ncbi:hypothetical protein BX600DRAFT_443692 [Xylariales sp. PMI_506]|nr:hypothetical protein BX600DRAFT_443692 [Xylariales sp. PMI_506]
MGYYVSYVLWSGLAASLCIDPYFGWRFSRMNWAEHKTGAIVAAIIIGVGLVLIFSFAVYRDWRIRKNSRDGTDWHLWVIPWSRKGKAQVRELAGHRNEQEYQDRIRRDHIQKWNKEHSRRGSNNKNDGEGNDKINSHNHINNGNIDTYSVDVEKAAEGASPPVKPPPAYTPERSGQFQKDPNPTSLLNV